MSGKRVKKTSPIIKLFSSLDKLISYLGTCSFKERETIQKQLYHLLSALSSEKDIKIERIEEIEKRIIDLEENLPPLKNFIIPNGKSSHIHFARSLCREAELISFELEYRNVSIFLNRLSDYLFLIAYRESLKEGKLKEF